MIPLDATLSIAEKAESAILEASSFLVSLRTFLVADLTIDL